MTDRRLDVLAIGNAIVDVIPNADDAFLAAEAMHKGAMRLIDETEATRLYAAMGPGRELSGGSAANTVAGIASLGLESGFIGQLADDQLGSIFAHDIQSLGVEFGTDLRTDVATARCLILVTPDAQRTMNTFLGAAQCWAPTQSIRRPSSPRQRSSISRAIYRDPAGPRAAMYKAMDAAREAGTSVAFTLSIGSVVERHRDNLWDLLHERRVDILANEAEITRSLTAKHESAEEAALAVAAEVKTVVVTQSEKGAFALANGRRISTSTRSPMTRSSTQREPATCSPPDTLPANKRNSLSAR